MFCQQNPEKEGGGWQVVILCVLIKNYFYTWMFLAKSVIFLQNKTATLRGIALVVTEIVILTFSALLKVK